MHLESPHRPSAGIRLRRRPVLLGSAVLLLTGSLLALGAGLGAETSATGTTFGGERAEIERFMEYNRSITLTPEQEALRVEALEALPAPCCKEFSAATCCCECNLRRATWGLTKHLIVDEGYGVEQIREAVAAWHHTINPAGFSGDSCFTGGCGRPFAQNGCGGMKDGQLIY